MSSSMSFIAGFTPLLIGFDEELPTTMIVPKNSPLKPALNWGLAKMRQTGVLERISKQYFRDYSKG